MAEKSPRPDERAGHGEQIPHMTEREQMGGTLLEAEQFARSIIDALSTHIAILDEQGTILTVNKAWRDFAAANAAAPERCAEGVNYLAVCRATNGQDAQTAAAFAEGIQSVLQGQHKEFSLEYACHSAQERRWFIGRVTRFLTENSVRIVVAHENITHRRHVEAELQAAYQKLNSHVENSPLAVIEWDSQFRVQRWSAMAEKMFGWTAADVLGKRPQEWRFVYEEDAGFLLDRESRLLRGEELPRQTIFHNRNYTKDGQLRECEWYNSELADGAGHLLSILSLVQDVTTRKQAELALRQERDFAESLIEMAQVIVLVLDTAGSIVRFNPYMEELSGYRLEEVQGKDWFATFLPHRYQDSLRNMFEQALQDRPTRGTLNPIVTKGGPERTIEWYDKTLKDNAGQITGLLCIGVDITERIRIEAELRSLNTDLERRVKTRTAELQASEQRLRELSQEQEQLLIASDRLVSLGELAASLTHEFNNPLGIILGFAQDLLSEGEPSDPSHQRLQIIEAQTRRCSQLIHNLRDLAQPPQTQRMATDLAALVRRSLDLVAGRLRQYNIETQLALADPLNPLHVDPQQVEQVLLNIYFNAIEAMPDGGRLSVQVRQHRAAEAQNEMQIVVTDTGGGIAPEHQAKIFRPFFTTKKQRGMGLGLSICDSIIRAHGGRISVVSSVGQGTTVVVHLPLDAPSRETAYGSHS